jgi:hypothetical protein
LKGILKLPLVLAVVVIVLRIIVERAGAPENISNLFSAVALHTVLVPVYLAIRLAGSDVPRPYLTLLRLILTYVVITRAILLVVYWLARIFRWQQGRFGGLSDSSPLMGFFVIPFATAAFWIVASVAGGGAIACVILAIMKAVKKPA